MKTKILLLVVSILYSLLSFATSYTWTGTTSTAWALSTNWTPSGTPGSGDNVTIVSASNLPALSGNVTVTNFTMTSGTLSLGGYTLTATGTVACNGGTINSGTLNATGSSSTFAGTTFGAVVTVNSASVLLNGSRFNNNATFTKTGTGTDAFTGGNVFNDTLIFNQSGSGTTAFAVSSPDTFNYAAYFNVSGNYLGIAYAAANNYFAGNLHLAATSTAGILLNYTGTASYLGNIYVSSSTTATISFGQSTGSATLASGKTIVEGGAGFSAGYLKFKNFTKYGSTPVSLDFGTGTSSLEFNGNCTINGTVTYSGGIFFVSGSTFNHDVSLTMNYAYATYCSGGNIFNGSTTFTNNTAQHLYLANTTGDDFNGNVTFVQGSTGLIYPGYNGTTTYAGNITANGANNCEYGYGAGLSRNVLDGSTVQYVGGTAPEHRFLKLKVDKSGGYVDLESPVGILDSLVLTDGIVKTTTTDYLMVRNNAKAIGASDSSHVEGVVVKGGDDAFTYPVGRNGHYRQITMSAPASTSDLFYAEYFNKTSNDNYSHGSKDGSIAALGRSEYWNLVRYVGSSTVNVTLSWDTLTTSCSFASAANLKVCAWDGSQWKDKGNGGTTGNLVKGTVITSSASSNYGAYAIGTSASFYCEPGVSCADVIDLNSSNTCVASQTLFMREKWYKFTAESSDMEVSIINYGIEGTADIDSIVLYPSCGGSIIDGFIGYDDGKLLVMNYTGLTPSSDYYTKLVISNNGIGDANYKFCVQESIPVSFENDVEETEGITATENCDAESTDYDDFYGRIVSYKPGVTAPVKTIKVNIAVFQDSNGENNFHDDDHEDVDGEWYYLKKLIDRMNEKYGTNAGPSDPLTGVTELPSTNIQFDLGAPGEERIHFYQDDYLNRSNERAVLLAAIAKEDPQRLDNLNIIFTNANFGDDVRIVNINQQGSGYNSSPTATFSGGGSGANVFISVDNTGSIDGIAIENEGTGYDPAPNATQINITDPYSGGSNYVINCFVSPFGGRILTCEIIDGGTGYTPTPHIIVNDNVTTATALGHVVNGKIDWVEILDNGFGYSCEPRVYHNGITDVRDAVLSSEINGSGEVTAINVLDGGCGYTTSTVNLIVSDGIFYTSTPIIPFVNSSNEIEDVAVVFGEMQNYNCPPELEVVGGGGSGAELEVPNFGYDNVRGLALLGHASPEECGIDGSEHYGIIMYRCYTNYENEFGKTQNTLGHELAHCLSLDHLYDVLGPVETCNESDPDYLDDCFDVVCPHLIPSGFSEADLEAGGPDEYTNNIMGSSGYQNYFSPKQIGKMHRSLSLNSVRRYVKESPYDITPLEITQDEIWDFDIRWYSDIIVKSGHSLTITCKVLMADQAKIIVEPGAVLIIDGGTVTAAHEVWQGIEVWGNPTQPQGTISFASPLTSSTYQGLIVMKNGAVIENARLGVNLSREGYGTEYNGGVIQAEDSKFRNCRKSVAFMQYKPTNTTWSKSYFENVVFLCDQPMQGDDYIDSGDRPLGVNGFVSVWDVKNVKFTDCDFVVDLNDDYDSDGIFYDFDEDIRGTGIGCNDARVEISNTTGQNRFINLSYGIQSGKTVPGAGLRKLIVKGALFENTQRGIHTEGAWGDYINEANTFNVPSKSSDINPYGIYTWNSMNYYIEDNDFNVPTAGSAPWATQAKGVINKGLKLSGGKVRHNDFDGFYVAQQTEVFNPYLRISCNDYADDADNALDWAVNPESQGLILGPQGIGCNPVTQKRAGNKFYNSGENHIYNFAQPFVYVYPNITEENPNPSSDFNSLILNFCNAVTSLNETSCDAGGIIVIGDEKIRKKAWDDELEGLDTEYATVEGSLDNGQNASMKTNIANSGYSNSTLTTELIANSPLSDEVLIAALGRTSFSTQQKIDFTVPNSPVSYTVWQAVKSAFAGSVHQDIIDAQVESTVRTLTAIERDMGVANSEVFDAVSKILEVYANDNDSISQLLRYLADTLNTKEARIIAVGACLEADSIELAREVLDVLELELTDAEGEAIYDFYDIAVSLAEEEKSWFEMDGAQKSAVQALAGGSYDIKTYAQAVLTLVYDSVYTRIPEILPDSSAKWDGAPPTVEQDQETDLVKSVKVFPNPFNNNFNINYVLEEEAAEVRIEIYDLVGRTVLTRKVGRSISGSLNIDLGECLGIYLLRIYADDKQVHKEKLICIQR